MKDEISSTRPAIMAERRGPRGDRTFNLAGAVAWALAGGMVGVGFVSMSFGLAFVILGIALLVWLVISERDLLAKVIGLAVIALGAGLALPAVLFPSLRAVSGFNTILIFFGFSAIVLGSVLLALRRKREQA